MMNERHPSQHYDPSSLKSRNPDPLPPGRDGLDPNSSTWRAVGWWWLPIVLGACAAGVIDAAGIVYAVQYRTRRPATPTAANAPAATYNGRTITLEIRESLLPGPEGFLKLQSTWAILADGTRRRTTIIPFGG